MCGSSARMNFCEYAKFYVNERGLASERKPPLIVALKRKHTIQKKRCEHYNVRGPLSVDLVAPP